MMGPGREEAIDDVTSGDPWLSDEADADGQNAV